LPSVRSRVRDNPSTTLGRANQQIKSIGFDFNLSGQAKFQHLDHEGETTDSLNFPLDSPVSNVSTFRRPKLGDIIVTGAPSGDGVPLNALRYPRHCVLLEVAEIGVLRSTDVNLIE